MIRKFYFWWRSSVPWGAFESEQNLHDESASCSWCDTHFPLLNPKEWKETERMEFKADEKTNTIILFHHSWTCIISFGIWSDPYSMQIDPFILKFQGLPGFRIFQKKIPLLLKTRDFFLFEEIYFLQQSFAFPSQFMPFSLHFSMHSCDCNHWNIDDQPPFHTCITTLHSMPLFLQASIQAWSQFFCMSHSGTWMAIFHIHFAAFHRCLATNGTHTIFPSWDNRCCRIFLLPSTVHKLRNQRDNFRQSPLCSPFLRHVTFHLFCLRNSFLSIIAPPESLLCNAIKGAMVNPTSEESLIRIFMEGPDVSLKGSPTVSPTTAALWGSDFL